MGGGKILTSVAAPPADAVGAPADAAVGAPAARQAAPPHHVYYLYKNI